MNNNHRKDEVMDGELLKTYQLLEEFSKGEPLTQRDISTRLDIALGLTNAYIKRLILKGYIKVKSVPKKRFLYYLTPKGFAEKSRLTYLYLNYSFNYYRETKKFFLSFFQKLNSDGVEKILFYGYGDMQEIAYICSKQFNIRLLGIISDNLHEGIPADFNVYTVEELGKIAFDRIILFGEGADLELDMLKHVPPDKMEKLSLAG